jgi:quercetin dioxygenase-like cupin family protein
MSSYVLGVLCWLAAAAVPAAEPLLQSTTSWDGGAFEYPDGKPEVTSVILAIGEGDEPPFHCHPVPTMGYVLRGVLQVETADGNKAVFRAGESVVEVMRTVHRGVAVEPPVEVVVFYAGAEGVPVTVLPDDDPAGHCR